LWFTTQVPSELGTFYGDYKTQEVSIERMLELIRPESPQVLVETHPVYQRGPLPAIAFPERTAADRLERLEVRNLTYRHRGNGLPGGSSADGRPGQPQPERGVEDVNFTLLRGQLAVVTGRVGS